MMKHHTISLLAVFLGMLAVLEGVGNLSHPGDPGNRSAATEQDAPAPAYVMSGTGVVEAIQLRRAADNGRALLGKLLLDGPAQSALANAKVYSIRVRMGDGVTQTVLQDSAVGLQVGERVRLDSGRVYRS